MPARTPSIWPRLALAIVALTAGCSPKIGNKCTTSTDCSTQGDRLCDTSEPDGYCTIFNCDPDTCPSEADCVGFHDNSNTALSCLNTPRWPRFERTFCLRTCDSDGDCRDGYVCADANALANTYDAEIVDSEPSSASVCVVAGAIAPVCASTGGTGGTGGAGGSIGVLGGAAGARDGASGSAGAKGGAAGHGGFAGTAGRGGAGGNAGAGGKGGAEGAEGAGASGASGAGGNQGAAGQGGDAGAAGAGG